MLKPIEENFSPYAPVSAVLDESFNMLDKYIFRV
jgi:hypothetical protein